jgi:hypothetical protein
VTDPVVEARARFEGEVAEVRRTLDEEWGWAPRGARWIAPVVAVAVGFLAASALRKGARRWLR